MAIQIDIVSDTVCPWCYVGKRRMEKALANRPGLQVAVNWRPYQLNPDMPAKGMDRKEYMKAKFGGRPEAQQMFEALVTEGRKEGIDFDFDRIERAPNTLDSHRLIRWAGSAGVQDAVVEGLFRAYFLDGKDISDRQILISIADAADMDAGLVERLLEEGRDIELVSQEVATARQMGIQGVPCFILAGKYAISGAQSAEVLGNALDQAAGIENASSE